MTPFDQIIERRPWVTGPIDISSTPNRATTLEGMLPYGQEEAGEDSTGGALPSGQAILVVEDEETLRLSVCKMLRRNRFSVLEADNGDLAVNLIRTPEENFDLVLLDHTMPGKSSREVIEELRRVRPEVKVIVTSAYGPENVTGSLQGLEFDGFLRKPYHLNELIAAVHDALRSQTHGESNRRLIRRRVVSATPEDI